MYLIYNNLFDKLRQAYFKKILQDYGGINKKILDYGCGPGDTLLVAKKMGIPAYGIDLFDRSVSLAKKRGLKVTLGDYHNLNKYYSKEFFDVIFLQSVVEHMSQPILELLALKQYLKPGGYLIISSPTPSTYFWDDPTHVRPFTPKSFQIMADVLDLKPILVTYVFAYLLNLNIKTRLIYLLLNCLPFSLGSNLVGVYQNKKASTNSLS